MRMGSFVDQRASGTRFMGLSLQPDNSLSLQPDNNGFL